MSNGDDQSFLRRYWYVLVVALVLLCICLVVIVVVFLARDRLPLGIGGAGGAVVVETPTPAVEEVTEEPDEAGPTATPAQPEPEETLEEEEPALPGQYGLTIRAARGNLEHAIFILMRRWMDVYLRQSDITVEGQPPWVDVTGDLAEDGTFTAEGRGTVAGYTDIAVVFTGTVLFDEASGNYVLDGELEMGAEGGLPGGQSITYEVTGERIGPLDDPEALNDGETIEDFIPTLAAAVLEQDVDFMLERLHPVAVAYYGEEGCQSYVEGLDDPAFAIEVLDIQGPQAWLFQREGLTADVPNTYFVDANVTSGGQTSQSELHFPVVNGELRWVPDCGDALP